MLVPKETAQELKHFIPSDYLGKSLEGIKPFEGIDWRILGAKIIVKSFDTVLDVALKANRLFNSDKELSKLSKDLQNEKAELELELNQVLNIHPAQTIDFNQAKKIMEIQELLNQINKQLKIITKIREESHVVRNLKNVRNKFGNAILVVAADMVSPRTKPKNR